MTEFHFLILSWCSLRFDYCSYHSNKHLSIAELVGCPFVITMSGAPGREFVKSNAPPPPSPTPAPNPESSDPEKCPICLDVIRRTEPRHWNVITPFAMSAFSSGCSNVTDVPSVVSSFVAFVTKLWHSQAKWWHGRKWSLLRRIRWATSWTEVC